MLSKKIKIIFAVFIVVASVVYRHRLELLLNNLKVVIENYSENIIKHEAQPGVFTDKELLQFNGIDQKNLYLSILGHVFDVTKGHKFYGKDSTYNYFTGKDGSRALVTGDFKDETLNKDHVLDFTCNQLQTLLSWKNTFREKYEIVGVLYGRYYNKNGKPTEYSLKLDKRMEECQEEDQLEKKKMQQYPPCNMSWSAEDGTKVWCTVSSGGVQRNWVGVPRQLYGPSRDHPQCVCVNLNKINSDALLKVYDNCDPSSTSCVINNNNNNI